MKQKLKIPFLISMVSLPTFFVISCNSNNDYMVMAWDIDKTKVEKLKNDWQAFNQKEVSLEKLKEIIKGDGNNLSRYTTEAFDQSWFEKIEFELKNETPNKLVIKLKNKINKNGKEINCPYRLPNNKLEWKYNL